MQQYWILIFSFLLTWNCHILGQTPYDEVSHYGAVSLLVLPKDKTPVKDILDLDGVYLDHGSTQDSLKLVVTAEGLRLIELTGLEYAYTPRSKTLLQTKSPIDLSLPKNSSECLPVFDYYPDYNAYLLLMDDFTTRYPDLCKTVEMGTLTSGRKILAVRIGSNKLPEDQKPGFMYSACMHGDEIIAYPLMLQLIDYLLCNYGLDDRVTQILDELVVFINPLANPDGMFRAGDNDITGAIRFNSQFVDLNRNFPDPEAGMNPDGRETQEETEIFIQFAEEHRINMSCNLHSGVELINYPWDTYPDRHADNDWFVRVSRDYANSAQVNSPEGYFTDQDNGITHGHDWYELKGGRQDFHTYFKRGREVTLELSDIKLLSADSIPNHWIYNRDALIQYMSESLYGLRGRVTDCVTGKPVKAEIFVDGYDEITSSVFSDSLDGWYFRYLPSGAYPVRFLADGYADSTVIVDVYDKSTTLKNMELCPDDLMSSTDNLAVENNIQLIGNKILFSGEIIQDYSPALIYDMSGRMLINTQVVDMSISLSRDLDTGIYAVVLTKAGRYSTIRFIMP